MNKYIFIGFFLTCMLCGCSSEQNIPKLRGEMLEYSKHIVLIFALSDRENSLIFILDGPHAQSVSHSLSSNTKEASDVFKIITSKGEYDFEWHANKFDVLICGQKEYQLNEGGIVSLSIASNGTVKHKNIMRGDNNISFSKLNYIQMKKLIEKLEKDLETRGHTSAIRH